MMMDKRALMLMILDMAVAITACRKPYLPPAIAASTSLLVVEGVIVPGADSTIIRLSHTVKLSEKTSSQPETGATVTVEGNGASYNLMEISNGTYAATNLSLNAANKYRLKIRTASGQEYQSDEMEVKVTPPIDSLAYKIEADGLHIYSAAHDATNNTRYYRWDYQETWRYNSLFESKYKVGRDTVIPREYPADEIYKCYGSYQASTILLGSTVKLAQDIVTQNPITQIAPGTERLSMRYSIKLNQYALTKEAYAFWENLKKNTEQLGSIFDALPSEISGNVHNLSNPATPVIGYVSISTVSSKRIYIDRTELPFTPEWRDVYPYDGCKSDYGLYVDPRFNNINTVKGNIIESINFPIDAMTVPNPRTKTDSITGFSYASRPCVDCTLRGSPKRPAFWADK
jgi:hypothetical protein